MRLSITLLTAGVVAVKLLSLVATLQRKEYRLDRLRAALTDGEFTIPTYLYGLHALAAGLSANLNAPVLAGSIAGLAVGSELAYRTLLLIRIGLHRPRPTAKAQLLLTSTAILMSGEWVILTFAQYPPLTTAAILLVSTLPTVLLAGWVVNHLANLRKRHVIAAATRLRAGRPVTVIAITGSYGKTSTKHFLQQLMPQAAVSAEHRNETYVIATDMLRQLTEATRYYITEVGAYKRGEIAELGKLVQPGIGVITAIGNQHLSLFGSQQNITTAKWELVAALPAVGIAVLNADDPRLKKQAMGHRGRIIWFSTQAAADVSLIEQEIEPTKLTARLTIGQYSCTVTLPVAGRGALANVAAAAAAAWAAGVAPEDICQRLLELRPYPRTMEVVELPGGALLIDDSYSANEQGALDAIEHLARFPQPDKRVLLLPLIELGKDAGRVHRAIGRALAKSGAKAMTYTKRHHEDLAAGAAKESQAYTIRSATRPREAVEFVTKKIGPTTVILLENRIPDVVRQELLKP